MQTYFMTDTIRSFINTKHYGYNTNSGAFSLKIFLIPINQINKLRS